jgi:protein-disulfide isomerase
LRKLLADHAGRIRLAFRYFPLRPAGKPLLLATAAECARRQGRFWEAHDRLFARSPVIETAADLATELDDLGLDQAAFAECLAAEDVAARVRADLEAGLGYGVSFTPTLFINGRRPVATDLATLNRAVAASLAKGEA